LSKYPHYDTTTVMTGSTKNKHTLQDEEIVQITLSTDSIGSTA